MKPQEPDLHPYESHVHCLGIPRASVNFYHNGLVNQIQLSAISQGGGIYFSPYPILSIPCVYIASTSTNNNGDY